MSVVAYRLLRDVRQEGTVTWVRAGARIPDARALDAAVDWLCQRGLVRVDQNGIAASPIMA